MLVSLKKKKNAFTLIELVIVIAILALLIAIAIPRYQKSNLSAQAAAHNANVRMLKNAGILYLTDNPSQEKTSLGQAELGPYLEGEAMPSPAKSLGVDAFTVTAQGGNVSVSPGQVEVQGSDLVVVE